MEITYLGHSAFKIRGRQATLVIDPFDPQALKLPKSAWKKQTADLVLVTHDHPDHNFTEGVDAGEGPLPAIASPGEYEVKGVRVFGFPSFHDAKGGQERGQNTIYLVEMDGFSLVHLGDLGHKLSEETSEELSTVDVLFIPVGGTYTIDAEAATEIIANLEPTVVVPMHYQDKGGLADLDPLGKFLKAMGKIQVKQESKLKLSSPTDLPEETTVVVLEHS